MGRYLLSAPQSWTVLGFWYSLKSVCGAAGSALPSGGRVGGSNPLAPTSLLLIQQLTITRVAISRFIARLAFCRPPVSREIDEPARLALLNSRLQSLAASFF